MPGLPMGVLSIHAVSNRSGAVWATRSNIFWKAFIAIAEAPVFRAANSLAALARPVVARSVSSEAIESLAIGLLRFSRNDTPWLDFLPGLARLACGRRHREQASDGGWI